MFLKEIKHNFFNFLLSLIGVIAAVTCIVLFFMMTDASQNETRRLTRDMGFNLKLIPKNTDMNSFWVEGYSSQYIPQDYVNTLVSAKAFSYAHLTATLHKKIEWKGCEVILTGISPEEVETRDISKSKMIFAIPKGSVYIGYELASKLDIKDYDKFEILGASFNVERILAETGSNDDIRIYLNLPQLQKMLNLEGKINEIMAINCLCASSESEDPLELLRTELNLILPNAKVIMNRTIASAREKQRKMIDSYMALLMPIFIFICSLWIAVFSMQNVMHRKTEIGLLRSLGFNKLYITKLFIYRSLTLGLIGSLIGFILATGIGVSYGPDIFQVTARSIKINYELLYYSLLLAPLFAVVSSFVSIAVAITQEPAKVLKER